MEKSTFIYFDNASTTKVDDRVIQSMIPYMSEHYGNSASSHKFGAGIKVEVENVRKKVAYLINAQPHEITFSSGATESINTLIKGLYTNKKSNRSKIVTIATEHSAVLDTCKYLEDIGANIIYLPVESNGLINLETLRNHVDDDTLLVAVMLANNETGVLQALAEITQIAKSAGALIMTDATQAVGKITIDVVSLGVDLMVFSAHKFYGPKGIGAMYIKKDVSNYIFPLLHGGGHEKGKRSGTLNVPGIIGLGKAIEIAMDEMSENERMISSLRNTLESRLLEVEGAFVNGDIDYRIYNICNITFPGINSDMLIKMLDNIYVSSGSACSSALIEPSHVLKAMGLDDEQAFSSIRFSLGKNNTMEEVLNVVERIKNIIAQLKQLNYG